ncbi:MAG: hypothetical protein FD161_4097 [Limisphaerales bacterium]|nr:MAG: hypothetical protein FD161_4097 [Limisphaerales bacterium]KAG0507175.1 MAG: hypothetical protein E1N63_3649 [Limisphaerales bacterium]TXT46986.1 MAG: hypothetical protein FD140_4341 [Limisphaerales bacterium]
MKPLRQIAFVLEDFALQTPAQQLFDRFLLGHRRAGAFHKPDGLRVTVTRAGDLQSPSAASDLLRARAREAGLQLADLPAAVREADALVIVPRTDSPAPAAAHVTAALTHAKRGAACFVFGAPATNLAAARTLTTLAAARQITLASGTTLPVTWRLPQVDLPANAPADEALIVVQGTSPLAELHALDGLLPVLARRAGGELGVRRVKFLAGADLWRAADRREWSWGLLSAALSRSDSPQGDTLLDGRTQDLVGLGLVPKLASNPRGWLLEHTDGVRTALLALDGVVADFNFAVQLSDGNSVSAQLFCAPVPAQEHYSRLAAVIEDFFRTGTPPWPASRSQLTAGLLDACRQTAAQPGVWLWTAELSIR